LFVLLVLGISLTLVGSAQLAIRNTAKPVHTPGSILSKDMIKSVPLYGQPEYIETTQHSLPSGDTILDSAIITFVSKDDPGKIMVQYVNWFPNGGWQLRGPEGHGLPEEAVKGSYRTLGSELRLGRDFIPYLETRTELIPDYRLQVSATRKLCWLPENRRTTDNIDGITTVTIYISRLK
jgi:hypothetical protein